MRVSMDHDWPWQVVVTSFDPLWEHPAKAVEKVDDEKLLKA